VTVPEAGVTVAVNVTLWPNVIFAEDAVSDEVVAVGDEDVPVEKTKTVAEYAAKL